VRPTGGGSAADAQDDELFDFLLSSVDTPPGVLQAGGAAPFAADGQHGAESKSGEAGAATGQEAEESEAE